MIITGAKLHFGMFYLIKCNILFFFMVKKLHKHISLSAQPQGDGYFSPKSYMDVSAKPQKFDFLHTNFLPNYHFR